MSGGECLREIIINKNDAGQRLDRFLIKFMPRLPQSMLYKGLRKNAVRINDKHAKKPDIRIEEGDCLKLYFSDEFFSEEKDLKIKKAKKPEIVYEDDNIIVVNKQPGLPVHIDEQRTEDNLLSRIWYYLYEKGEYKPEKEHSFSPAVCNRLDRNTGGLVIAAKNALSLRIINEKIRKREIVKKYVCIAEGHFEHKQGILTGNLIRGDKKVIINENDGKEIKTGYKVLVENDDFSLVEVELFTGRTHQIRAHFASIGHPLRGDIKYGARKDDKFKFQALFAYMLEFDFSEEKTELDYLKGLVLKAKVPFDLDN